jgi:helicase
MRVDELNLPAGVADILIADGISELYPPQEKAVPIALEGKNLVVAVPTASGKSLIGYLAATKHVLEKGGKVMYIVPLRALASEKFDDLKKFEPLGIKVSMSIGDFDEPDKRLRSADIIVATSEKADALMRHSGEWLTSISLVVADEVHLINDPGRGPTLEVTLAKFKRYNPNIQIIALSATVGNSKELAKWLDAEHISSKWRPVKLKEGVYSDEIVRFTDNTKKKIAHDEDPVWSLIKDSLSGGGQCIVFVNTRKSTESLATKYSKFMKNFADKAPEEDDLKDIDGEVEHTSMARSLKACLKKGVAFHHAGLTNEQRRYVESSFKKGQIKVIIATPTLAAGINLPARRVIIRDVQRYEDGGYVPIPVMEIKQMCGRAGRPRYDTEGEAIVVAKNEDDASFIFDNYLLADSEDIYSKLGQETVLRGHVLSSIATETVCSWKTLMEFLSSTFFAHQSDISEIEEITKGIIDFLEKEGMIVVEGDDYRATFFGQRVSDMYIDPLTAVKLRDSLKRYQRGMGYFGFLHAICATPDMMNIYTRRNDGEWLEATVEKRCKDLLCDVPEDEEYEFFLSEFKTAMTLDEWVSETEEEKILDVMGIGPGDLRSKVDLAKWLIYSMRELSGLFNKEAYPPLTDLMKRMEHGVKQELLGLVRLKGVGRVRARSLYKKGFTDVDKISQADIRSLAAVIGIGDTMARKLKEQVGGTIEPLETSARPEESSSSDETRTSKTAIGSKKGPKQTTFDNF